ncbi:MAG TPA: glucokinase [Burkholderiales bacterium]|nr:glucokinase [Burkholderiales bacterium]
MRELVLGGDIGGTRSRLAIAEVESGMPRSRRVHIYANDDFSDFNSLLRRFLQEEPMGLSVVRVCLGLAGPQEGGAVQLTNRDWTIRTAEVESLFPHAKVQLVNDFETAAYGIDLLASDDLLTLQAGQPMAQAPQLVIGAGTGLGVAYRLWIGNSYRVLAGEGGHASFAPIDEQQLKIWRAIYDAEGRVSDEMLISGAGIARIFSILSRERISPPEVSRRAMEKNDPTAKQTLEIFARCYGAVAGDHALAILARGGVFMAGGVAPRIHEFLQASRLLEAFNAKGHHTPVAQRMPVHVVLNEQLGLLGATLLAARGE